MPRRTSSPAAPAVAAVAATFGRDVERCLTEVERTIRRARARGAQLVVFPECTLGGYVHEPGPAPGEPLDPPPMLSMGGPELAWLARVAGPTVVCLGYTEAAPGGPYSSAVCLNGDGVLGHHRKVHIPPGERAHFRPGDGFAAFDTPFGRMGMLVCYDKTFPEAARTLALDGAEIIASLAAWPQCRVAPASRPNRDRQARHFDLLDQARAVENQVVWVSANHAGNVGGLRFFGGAKVVDPDGTVLARAGARGGLALARLDVGATVARVRGALGHLPDRRPGAYDRPLAIDAPSAPPALAGPALAGVG